MTMVKGFESASEYDLMDIEGGHGNYSYLANNPAAQDSIKKQAASVVKVVTEVAVGTVAGAGANLMKSLYEGKVTSPATAAKAVVAGAIAGATAAVIKNVLTGGSGK